MKKILAFALALTFALSGVVFADVQLDEGQSLSTPPKVFQMVRYGRTGAIATAGGHSLSKDMLVIWDTTSHDGVSVLATTTSGDNLVAGVLLDNITGSSRDNTAAEDESSNNWGRLQVSGYHADVRTDNKGEIKAGATVCPSTRTAGTIMACGTNASDDIVIVGTALEDESSATVDVMLRL